MASQGSIVLTQSLSLKSVLCVSKLSLNLFLFFIFYFLIGNKIYIDNSKVEEADETSFPQSTKPD